MWIGLFSLIVGIYSYALYYKDIFAKKTKPHRFTYLVWTLITTISFFGQIVSGAGPGAWVMGLTVLGCLGIFILSFKYGEKEIVLADWLALSGALIALISWVITRSPTIAAILISLTDALALVPTIRKSFHKPYDETLISYFIGGLQFAISLFAIQSFSIATAFYPASIALINWSFAVMLIIRRRVIKAPKGF